MPAFLVVAVATVALSAKTHDSHLALTFTNPTAAAITKFPMRINLDDYDWLGVELVDTTTKTKRTINFLHDRDKSVLHTVDIPAHGSVTEEIDLAAIALEDNKPIDPGTYALTATWETEQHDKLTATTTLTIAAPKVSASCTSTKGTLEVHAFQDNTKPDVVVALHNPTADTMCVAARISAGEDQNDWMTITVDNHPITFQDTRKKSALVLVELPPGATYLGRWDLKAWAARAINHNRKLPKDMQWATLVYDTTNASDGWKGKATTGFTYLSP